VAGIFDRSPLLRAKLFVIAGELRQAVSDLIVIALVGRQRSVTRLSAYSDLCTDAVQQYGPVVLSGEVRFVGFGDRDN